MKTISYTEPQLLSILRQAEGGMPVSELCRAHGMSTALFYKWRAKYGGMDASMIAQTKAIEVWGGSENSPGDCFPDEWNRRLKKMFAELSMQNELLKEALGKKQIGHLNAARWPRMQWRDAGQA